MAVEGIIAGLPAKEYYRNFARLKYYKKYNITEQIYNEMFENQKESCAICDTHVSQLKRRLAVDHNHKTNKARALLCDKCNLGLGNFCDDIDLLQKALDYLKKHNKN